MATSNAPEQQPLPTQGGSYVREGEELTRIEHTAPPQDKVATNPGDAEPPAVIKE